MSHFAGAIEFDKLLAGRADIDLVQLMLDFAADAYPELDRLGCLLEIDRLGVACEEALPVLDRTGGTRTVLRTISRVLYEVEGFHGNRECYYDPRNSYINQVLSRRCGIPISLGILYIAVASRLGLPMFGANTPAHFVVGCESGGELLLVDAFNQGEVLTKRACRERIEEVLGQTGVVCDEHFRPASAREIAARVLRNLKAAYAMESHWAAVLPVQQKLLALLPRVAEERRDLGLICLRTGRPREALDLLNGYLEHCSPEQAAVVESSRRAARKLVAELN